MIAAPASPTELHCVRHAQTTWGAEGRYAGLHDVGLSPRGKQDCSVVREALNAHQFDVVITSPLTRARDTARLITADKVPVEIDPVLAERCYGELEGRTWQEALEYEPPILFIQVGGDTHSVNPPGAEPFEDVWFRARSFAQRVLEERAGQSVLIVGHSVFLQMLYGVFLGSSCIEALGHHCANLELASFTFAGRTMTNHQIRRLVPSQDINF